MVDDIGLRDNLSLASNASQQYAIIPASNYHYTVICFSKRYCWFLNMYLASFSACCKRQIITKYLSNPALLQLVNSAKGQ